MPYANANAESPTPCRTVASSSQIIDSVMLRDKTRKCRPEPLMQSLRSNQVLVYSDISYNTGFTLPERNGATEAEGAPSQMVTDHKFAHRTQRGAFTKRLPDTDFGTHSQTNSKGPMNDTQMLESELHQLENDLTVDPIAESYFSKSFMANKEVPQTIRQQCHNSKDFQLSKTQNGHDFGFIPLTDVKTYQGPSVT